MQANHSLLWGAIFLADIPYPVEMTSLNSEHCAKTTYLATQSKLLRVHHAGWAGMEYKPYFVQCNLQVLEIRETLKYSGRQGGELVVRQAT